LMRDCAISFLAAIGFARRTQIVSPQALMEGINLSC
jgi:hypothetical protein